MYLLTKDVLLVDADEPVRGRMVAELARLDISCDTAADGVEASVRAASTRYDVLLIDVATPRIDAAELIALLREREQRANLPIVLLISSSRARDSFSMLADSAQAVIHKPFDVADLAELVLGCIEVCRRTAAAGLDADAAGRLRPDGVH
jgi:CheY-like chemotaxis protein